MPGLFDDPAILTGLLGAGIGMLQPNQGGRFAPALASGLASGLSMFNGVREDDLQRQQLQQQKALQDAQIEHYKAQSEQLKNPESTERYGLNPIISASGEVFLPTTLGNMKRLDIPGGAFKPPIMIDQGGQRVLANPYTSQPTAVYPGTQTQNNVADTGLNVGAGSAPLPPYPRPQLPPIGGPKPLPLPPERLPQGATFNFSNPEEARLAMADYANNGAAMPGQTAPGGVVPVPGFAEEKARQEKLKEEAKLPAERERADIEVEKQFNKDAAKNIQEAQANLPKFESAANATLSMIEALKDHPGMSDVVGMPSLTGVLHLPGTNASDFRARLDQLNGRQFLQAFETLKGGGQITEVEGKKATDAVARMQTSQSEKEFRRAASEFQETIRGAIKRQRELANSSVKPISETGPQGQTAAPSVEDLLQKYGH